MVSTVPPVLGTWVMAIDANFPDALKNFDFVIHDWLVEHFIFSHILGIVIPLDFHIFQRGRLNHQPDDLAGC